MNLHRLITFLFEVVNYSVEFLPSHHPTTDTRKQNQMISEFFEQVMHCNISLGTLQFPIRRPIPRSQFSPPPHRFPNNSTPPVPNPQHGNEPKPLRPPLPTL